jgi:hypothetical protein
MKSDTLRTFARCRALALAAMIEAGGKPCWVATYAPDGSPAAGRPVPGPIVTAPAGRPGQSRPAPAGRPGQSRPAPPALLRGVGEKAPTEFSITPAERARYASLDDELVVALDRIFRHFADATPPPCPFPRSGGGGGGVGGRGG